MVAHPERAVATCAGSSPTLTKDDDATRAEKDPAAASVSRNTPAIDVAEGPTLVSFFFGNHPGSNRPANSLFAVAGKLDRHDQALAGNEQQLRLRRQITDLVG